MVFFDDLLVEVHSYEVLVDFLKLHRIIRMDLVQLVNIECI